jgi:hypothetical protein
MGEGADRPGEAKKYGISNQALSFMYILLLPNYSKSFRFLFRQFQESPPHSLMKGQPRAFQPVMPVFPVPGLLEAARDRHIQEDRKLRF